MKEGKLRINKSTANMLMVLDDNQAGELIKAICANQFTNNIPEDYIFDDLVESIYFILKEDIDKAKERAIKDKRRKASYAEKT